MDQLKNAHDSINSLDRRLTTVSFVPIEAPSPVPETVTIVKDSWTFASNWVTFVQTSSVSQRQEAYNSIAEHLTTVEPLLRSVLLDELTPDERLAKALTYSSVVSDSTERLAVMHAVKKAILLREPDTESSTKTETLPTAERIATATSIAPMDSPVAPVDPAVAEMSAEVPPKKRKAKKAAKKQVSDEASTISFD